MKLIFTLVFSCLFSLGFYTNLFAQWEASPVGFASPLNIWDMDAVDENIAWAITTDGTYSGNSWAISPSQTFATTADGGENWTVGEFSFPNTNWNAFKISAIDANTAWVAASSFSGFGGAIYKTTDGGMTWVQQEVFSSSSFCTVVHFWDANEGVAIGDPLNNSFEIYTTMDGGETWDQVDSESITNPLSASEFVSTSVCSVVGDHIWFGTRNGRVFHSDNRGQSWVGNTTPIATSNPSNTWVEGIAFRDDMVGIAHSANYGSVPFQSVVAYTTDGGLTWTEQATAEKDFSIFKAQYIEGSNVLVKTSRESNGDGPFITSFSYDNALSWTDIETGSPIADFDFLDSNTAWGGKFKNNNDPTVMYKYTGEELTNFFTPKPLDVEFHIQPNPATSFVNLKISTKEMMELTLEWYHINGQLIEQHQLGEGQRFNEVISVKDFPNGIYILKLRNASGEIFTKKVVKE